MSDDELLALIEGEEANCISSTSGALAEQRREAMQFYYGQKYGNEVEGRSQVVTSEERDAIEGIMPALMSIFASSDEIVRCDPQGPEDEAAAQQATDYINYLFRNNNGFLVLYCLCKDALLLKNGYAKVYWEEYTENGIETYENLSGLEVQMLSMDPELELEETEAAEGQEEFYTKVVFRRTRKKGKVCIDPVPPEEVLISRGTPNDLTKARFVEHKTLKTISEIREMGFDVPDDIADYSTADVTLERVQRESFDDANAWQARDDSPDPTTRQVWLCEAYTYVDFDDDGIAEYRKITKVGKTILDNVEFDSLPIIGGTAVLMPHKHYGLSVHDLFGDTQLIKSTVTRTLLNNAYVQNEGRMVVLDGMVNMDDLLTVRPNGVIRAKAMNAVQRLDNPLLGAPFYNLLDYFDKVAQNKVGVRPFDQAVDPDALNAKAHTAELVTNASQERIHLMARILAETVFKPLFWKIMEVVSKHQTKPDVVKLRNQWVQVDPREWKNKFNMTVSVGLGTGSQQTVINSVMMLAQLFAGAKQLGFRGITEQNFYTLLHKASKAVFPKDADQLVTNPATMGPPPQTPDPELLKIQLAAHKVEVGDAQKRDKMQLDAFLADMQRQHDASKTHFQAMVESVKEDKGHQVELAKEAMRMAQENRSIVTEKLAEIKQVADQSDHEKQLVVLQGQIDAMLESIKQVHEAAMQAKELAAAEREHEVSERDAKGKIKKTVSRVKKKP